MTAGLPNGIGASTYNELARNKTMRPSYESSIKKNDNKLK